MPGARPPTGENILLKVGALTDGIRAPVTGEDLKGVVGTSTGYQIGEQELSTQEFGTDAALWEDGAVIAKNWQIPLTANYRENEDGNMLIETTGLTPDELYVELYPVGDDAGSPYFYGYATVNSLNTSLPREGIITQSCTLQGRGELTKDTVPVG